MFIGPVFSPCQNPPKKSEIEPSISCVEMFFFEKAFIFLMSYACRKPPEPFEAIAMAE